MAIIDKLESGDGFLENSMTRKFGLTTAPQLIEANTNPEKFAQERKKIFRHAWMIVGRVDEVPDPGDYIVQDIPTLETSILVVRGRDNEIRAFHNMCRHRGNKVVHSGHTKGKAKGFSCAFHGWTYDLSGKLVIVPDEDQFFGFDKKDHGLTAVGCDVWEGWIFVSGDPQCSLEEWLGEMGGYFEGCFTEGVYERVPMFSHNEAVVDANWKVILDAFSEAYHVPFIHGQTVPEAISGGANPLCHLQSVRLMGLHRSLSAYANPDYKPTPMEMIIGKFAGVPVFPALKSDLEKLPKGVNPERDPFWGFDLHIVFPMSLFMVWANGMLLLYNFWPIAIDKTLWMVKLYMPRAANAAAKINQEITRSMVTAVVREDMSSLETTQETLLSGAADRINLSDQEILVRHGYKVVEDFLNGDIGFKK